VAKLSQKNKEELYSIAVDVLSRYELTDPKIKSFISNISSELYTSNDKLKLSTQKQVPLKDIFNNKLNDDSNINEALYKQLNSVVGNIKQLLQKPSENQIKKPEEKLPFFKKILVESLKNINRDDKLKDENNKTVIEKFLDRIVPNKQKDDTVTPVNNEDKKTKLSEDISDKSQELDFFKEENNSFKIKFIQLLIISLRFLTYKR
jgi:hypothetical protein